MGNFENLRLFFEIKINPLSIKSTSIVYNVEASVRANGEMQKKNQHNWCRKYLQSASGTYVYWEFIFPTIFWNFLSIEEIIDAGN